MSCVAEGHRPLALNLWPMALNPEVGLLRGATAQEETLCRVQWLCYATLFGDPMYSFIVTTMRPLRVTGAILSPDVAGVPLTGRPGDQLRLPWSPQLSDPCAGHTLPAIVDLGLQKPMLRGGITPVLAIARASRVRVRSCWRLLGVRVRELIRYNAKT